MCGEEHGNFRRDLYYVSTLRNTIKMGIWPLWYYCPQLQVVAAALLAHRICTKRNTCLVSLPIPAVLCRRVCNAYLELYAID